MESSKRRYGIWLKNLAFLFKEINALKRQWKPEKTAKSKEEKERS
jgi:hypothetical protein